MTVNRMSFCKKSPATVCLKVFILFLALPLSACGDDGLSRSIAQELLQKSDELARLRTTVKIHNYPKFAIQAGNQGFVVKQGEIVSGKALLNVVESKIVSAPYKHLLLKKAQKVTIRITDILVPEGKAHTAIAAFIWKQKNIPGVVKRFAINDGTGHASFRKFHDGWRLEKVKWKFSGALATMSPFERAARDADMVAEMARRK
jgi:hypothetical protein